MIVQPKIRGFICTTAHPEGCAAHVNEWIRYVKSQPKISGPQRVLVIGASTGFGLASRISAAFASGAATMGVFFERPSDGDKRTATPGWYNTAAFEKAAHQEGLYATSINGDAFSDAIKDEVVARIRADWKGGVDLVVYSIASPRRTDPVTGEQYSSVLKPIGTTFTNQTIDVMNGLLSTVTLEPATDEDVRHTTAVMGGDDWALWIRRLEAEGLLAPGVKTVAYTYIGPDLTYPIYRQGTIGRAKEHLEATAHVLDKELSNKLGGCAWISVNKALVTQASAAIPVVPLYISLLYRIMKAKGLHEGCPEQMYRLFTRLYADHVVTDAEGRIRLDDWEMREDVQQEVADKWHALTQEHLLEWADLAGYREEFYRLFGFGLDQVDYVADVAIDRPIPSMTTSVI